MLDRSPAQPESAGAADREAALLAELKRGDAHAFEQLVRMYSPRLLAVARRLLGNDDDARDALQDAFLSAFRALASFAGESRLGTWLHRIAVNAALMKLRKRRRHHEESIDHLLPSFLPDGHQRVPAATWTLAGSEALRREEDRQYVRECIEALPETHRTVLVLRDIEGLSTEEAARLLGIEENALKVRLHRARQALRTLFNARFGAEGHAG